MVSTGTCDNCVRGVLGIQAVRVKVVCTRWKCSGSVRGVASERFDSLSRKITCGAVYSDLSTPLSLPLSTMTYLDHTSVDTVIDLQMHLLNLSKSTREVLGSFSYYRASLSTAAHIDQ